MLLSGAEQSGDGRDPVVPSNISRSRRQKAFNEGRRAANEPNNQNPYDHPTLRRLWDEGRRQQQAGEIKTPIPPLAHGETRAQRPLPKPPGSQRPPPPRSSRDTRGPRRR
jgi:hypothetical protein